MLQRRREEADPKYSSGTPTGVYIPTNRDSMIRVGFPIHDRVGARDTLMGIGAQ